MQSVAYPLAHLFATAEKINEGIRGPTRNEEASQVKDGGGLILYNLVR